VTFGQIFAIYSLSEYTLASGDPVGLEYADQTFDLLQKYCTDTYRGGYYENLEPNWKVSEPGFHAGDRKSLDIHMHLMEGFTVLAECSKKEIHLRKLEEVVQILLNKMIDKVSGAGLNQFDLDFHPIPAIDIRRTWNAERNKGETLEKPTDTASYGHNLELAWLLDRAGEVLCNQEAYNAVIANLVDHALQYGVDHKHGGIYRDGPHQGEPLVWDKEWWQNSEALVGFLEAYKRFGDKKYFEAFYHTWNFSTTYFINHEIGEWRQLLNKHGERNKE
jgi:mannose/cellobiose epimerase-like protein (N-acyl-D-glucosamine 2-epimerase family)